MEHTNEERHFEAPRRSIGHAGGSQPRAGDAGPPTATSTPTQPLPYPQRMPAEFIYSTYKLARHYPPDRTVLEDISLSFYPGAKSGSSGPTAPASRACSRSWPASMTASPARPGSRPASRSATSSRSRSSTRQGRQENVLDGVRPVQDLIDVYNAVMAKWSDPDADYEAIGAEQAALEDRINAADAWSLERNVDIAMDALRCPPDAPPSGRSRAGRSAGSRSPGCCSSIPTCCSSTSPPTTSMPNGRMARALPLRVFRHRRGDHLRPVLPRQRREVDPRARSRAGHPVLGQLQQLAGAEARAAHGRGQGRRRPPAHARPRARLGAPLTEGPPIEGQGPPFRVRAAAQRSQRREAHRARARDRHPAGAAPRRPGHRGRAACARGSATGCSSRT